MSSPIVVRSRIRVDAPASSTWQILADYRHDSRWRLGVISMSQDTPGVVIDGTRTSEDFRMLGTRMTNLAIIDRVEPGREFHWKTTSGTDADGTRTVIPITPTTCDVQLETVSRPSGFVETLLRPLIRRTLQRSLDASLERLKALIEVAPPE